MRHYLYPLHLSKAFLFAPTLASALYLLLMRFLDRQYDEVFKLADSCVSDTPLSPEERQVGVQCNVHACRHAECS